MDSLFLLQFACFIFMLINAFFVALSHLHVKWENKRYERSRWMIVVALIGLAIQYAVQIAFRIPCCRRQSWGNRQYSNLYSLFFAYLHGNLQHRDHKFQTQKDDIDV